MPLKEEGVPFSRRRKLAKRVPIAGAPSVCHPRSIINAHSQWAPAAWNPRFRTNADGMFALATCDASSAKGEELPLRGGANRTSEYQSPEAPAARNPGSRTYANNRWARAGCHLRSQMNADNTGVD